MQPKQASEQELVKICMAELCSNAGFADWENLIQRDLKFLCDGIEAKTGVLISLSTIKRLLNGQFTRLPQIATLDAIAITSGYQNWQSFKNNKSPGNGKVKSSDSNRAQQPAALDTTGKKLSIPKIAFWSGIILLVALGLLALQRIGNRSISGMDKAQFSFVKVTGNDIPNTVVFHYNIDSVTADSFFIQQSWDRNRRVKINKHNYTLTDIYYEPGYHTAKLIANNKIIKTVPVSIPTDRWFFYAKEGFAKGKPEYILSPGGLKDGALGLTKEDLVNSKVDIQKENLFLAVYFPSVIKGSSDNFVLKFRIKVNELSNQACPFFMNEVFCQRDFMYFNSTLKGCTSELEARYGEKVLSGKTNDLSALGVDVRQWNNVEVTVKNKKVDVSINGIQSFSTTYHQSCGLITGLGFISNGLCEVSFVDLKTIDGKPIYSSDFGNQKAADITLSSR